MYAYTFVLMHSIDTCWASQTHPKGYYNSVLYFHSTFPSKESEALFLLGINTTQKT